MSAEETALRLVGEAPVPVILALLWYRIGKMEGGQEIIMRHLKIDSGNRKRGGLMGLLAILVAVGLPAFTPGCALNRPFLMSVTTDTNGAVTRSIGKITTLAIGPGMAEVMKQTARQSPKSGQSIGQSGVDTAAGLTTNDTRALGDIRAILGR